MTVTASRAPALLEATELHRRACEARHWLRQPDRVAALERIAKARGDRAAEQLAADMRAVREGRALA